MTDVARFSNATWAPRRIPRLIHQTWRTHDIPKNWKGPHDSIIQRNADEFKYHLWTDDEMDVFVKEHEPEFYRTTYTTYKYNIQRADSFRNVVLYHLGGIYIDLDNGCSRSFIELVNTLEALDPDSSHVVAYQTDEAIGFLIDFVISTAGHPLHKQIISRLHLFNRNYLFHYLTIYLSTGPLNVMLQERLFNSSKENMVRIMTSDVADQYVTRVMGRSWHTIGDKILLLLYARLPLISGPFMIVAQLLIVFAVVHVFLKYFRGFHIMNIPFKYLQINPILKSFIACRTSKSLQKADRNHSVISNSIFKTR